MVCRKRMNNEIINHWLWEDIPFSKGQAYLDLTFTANDNEVSVSIRTLAERWGWGKTKVAEFLNLLRKKKMIKPTRKRTKKRTWERTTYTILETALKRSEADKNADSKSGQEKLMENALPILACWNEQMNDNVKYGDLSMPVKAKIKSTKKYHVEQVAKAISFLKEILGDKDKYWNYNRPTFKEFMLGFTKLSVDKLIDRKKYEKNFIKKKEGAEAILDRHEKDNKKVYEDAGLPYPGQ